MTRDVLLPLGATAVTVIAVLASAGFVATHPKNASAPLQPPVARPSATPAPAPAPTGRIRILPGVQATTLPAITGTHVS
jgi:hypothetical protein